MPFDVWIVTVRVWPAGMGTGPVVGQDPVAVPPDAPLTNDGAGAEADGADDAAADGVEDGDGSAVELAGGSRLDAGLPVGATALGLAALPEQAASIRATAGNPSRTSHGR
ncbi:MAG TPA: hypothetical protein VNF73_05970 [Candidatus Saccharimonadales bacterium]|nr:hypothetical protein [Candidatus Saccharimonadales bacterium]